MRTVIGLALASLRYRMAASLATFIAIFLGSAILISCGGLFETAIRLEASPQRLAGAPVIVAGSPGFKLPDEESETVAYAERSTVDANLVGVIASAPGVAAAIPDVSFPAVVVKNGPGGTVLSGHGWESARLTPYTLREGSEPGTGQVVLDAASADRAGVRPGDQVDIAVNGQSQRFTLAGVARSQRRVDAAAIFFATDDVQRFTRPGQMDAIGVLPRDGVSAAELATQVAGKLPGGLSILVGEERGAAEFTGVGSSFLPLILLASVFGGMMLVVMALVVAATISLSVRQRQQELALLRVSGATPVQVHRMVVVETMAVAALAALGGVGLGGLLGGWIYGLTAARGVVPAALEFRQGIIPFAGGAVLSLAMAWLAATLAARAAARTRPIQALAEAAIPPTTLNPVRRLLAMVFAVATVGLAISTTFLDQETAAAVGGPALLTGAIAVGLFGPELIGILVGKVSGLVRRLAGGDLAVVNTSARAVAFAAVLTPITLAAAIALGNIYTQTTRSDAMLDSQLEQLSADAVITSATGGVAPELAAKVRELPGVTAASGLVTSRGWIEQPYDGRGSDPGSLLGIDAQAVLAVPVVAGSLRDLTGNAVAVPAEQAEELGIGLGNQITLRLGDGAKAEVKVVALLDSPADSGSLVLPADLLARHTTTGLASHLLVRGDPGGFALVAAISPVLQTWPGTTVGGQDALVATFEAGLDVEAWINYLLAALAIAYAAIASINTLAVSVLARRREFATLRLAGATQRQVMRMLLIEGTIIGVAGLGLGTVIALLTVASMAIAVGAILPSGPIWILLAVIAAIFLIVWPVTLIAGRQAMKPRPIEAISSPTT
jgi:putative ABC transport system permease protein